MNIRLWLIYQANVIELSETTNSTRASALQTPFRGNGTPSIEIEVKYGFKSRKSTWVCEYRWLHTVENRSDHCIGQLSIQRPHHFQKSILKAPSPAITHPYTVCVLRHRPLVTAVAEGWSSLFYALPRWRSAKCSPWSGQSVGMKVFHVPHAYGWPHTADPPSWWHGGGAIMVCCATETCRTTPNSLSGWCQVDPFTQAYILSYWAEVDCIYSFCTSRMNRYFQGTTTCVGGDTAYNMSSYDLVHQVNHIPVA